MLKTYNKENNTYSRYIHISEIEAALEKMKQISSRVEYKPFDEIPDKNQLEDYHVTIDDANSLEKMFADNPSFKLESPMDIMRRTILLIACGMSEDTEGIEYLINKGAEINRNDLMGENALMYVIQNPNMPTEEKIYSKPLTIELLNEAMKKVEKWHKEKDAAFLRIYSTAKNDIPNFDNEVDKMIKETIKKNWNISVEESVEYTDEQRKVFLKNNWWDKFN